VIGSRWTLGLLAGGGLMALLFTDGRDIPRLVWNATASAPEGVYFVHPGAPLSVGDLAAVRPDPELARWLDARGYLPTGALLIKRVAARPPSEVCRNGAEVRISGAVVAQAAAADRARRPLPSWRGCRALARGELFFLNPAPGSLDSRYFGPVSADAVVGRVTRLRLPGAPS
jgi:type IV secretory pathway protease TraF